VRKMKANRYLLGMLVVLLLGIGLSFAAWAQQLGVEQPAPGMEEQPTVPEEAPVVKRLPMDAAIKAALTLFPEAQAVSAKFSAPFLGVPVYLVELNNKIEVKVDAQTGEVLESRELAESSPEVDLLPQTKISLGQAVTTVLSAHPDRTAVEARLVKEEEEIVYLITLDNKEERKVDVIKGTLLQEPAPEEEETPEPAQEPIFE
jgi:uncharacterized membrane protein YkoI